MREARSRQKNRVPEAKTCSGTRRKRPPPKLSDLKSCEENSNLQRNAYGVVGNFPHAGQCPAINAKFKYCHTMSHYPNVCFKKKGSARVQAVTGPMPTLQKNEDEYLLIPCVTAAVQQNNHVYGTIQLGKGQSPVHH